jgi:hypothetical protein
MVDYKLQLLGVSRTTSLMIKATIFIIKINEPSLQLNI